MCIAANVIKYCFDELQMGEKFANWELELKLKEEEQKNP
jgi:hypothetical protein